MTQDMIDRIVVLLLAIADLAERAAFAPEARRRLALAILRGGEAATRDAFGLSRPAAAGRHRAPAGWATLSGDSPEDALALAMTLRALALIVRAMVARQLSSPMAREDASSNGIWIDRGHAAARRLSDAAPAQRLDTS